MQPWVATLLTAGVVVLINLATAAYVYGKLTQNVSAHEKRLDSHSARLNDHGDRLSNIEGWRESQTNSKVHRP